MSKLTINTSIEGVISTAYLPEDAHTDSTEIEELFDLVMSEHPHSDFLQDVYAWWEEKQFLTAAQYNTIKRLAEE